MGLKIGFQFVPFPQQIWDENIDLSHNGFRLLGYLIRHTIAWNNKTVKLTEDEFLHGRRDPDTGERMDQGCGIKSPMGTRAAQKELSALGWIDIRIDDSDKARVKKFFTVIVSESSVVPRSQILAPTEEIRSQTLAPRGSNFSPLASNFSPPTCARVPEDNPEQINKKIKEQTLVEQPAASTPSALDGASTIASDIASPTLNPESQPTLSDAAKGNIKEPRSRQRDLLWDAIQVLCKIDLSSYPRDRFAKEVKVFRDMSATAEDIEAFGRWWYLNDFRGLKGQAPMVPQMRESWPRAFEKHPSNSTNGSSNGQPKVKFSAIDEAVRRLNEIDAVKAKII